MLDGGVVERRFDPHARVRAVHDFVWGAEGHDGRPFSVSTVFPQQALPPEATLLDAGLCPRAGRKNSHGFVLEISFKIF